MAVTTTVVTGYDDSIKRDVDGQLALVAFTKTPLLSSIKDKACSTSGLVEKLEDNLADASATNAAVEGADVTVAATAAPGTIDNRVQRFEKPFAVSGDLEKTAKYARKSEIARIQGNKMKEIARDIEAAMTGGTRATGTASVAAKMDGIIRFADTATTNDFSDTAAAANQLTEAVLLDTMQAMFEEGADPDMVLAPPTQKRKISAFSQNGRITVNADASKKKLTMMVNILETDFGVVAVVPTIFMPSVEATESGDTATYESVAIYDSSKVYARTFRKLERHELGKSGDSRQFFFTCSKTILPDSKKCVGFITNLSKTTPSS